MSQIPQLLYCYIAFDHFAVRLANWKYYSTHNQSAFTISHANCKHNYINMHDIHLIQKWKIALQNIYNEYIAYKIILQSWYIVLLKHMICNSMLVYIAQQQYTGPKQ